MIPSDRIRTLLLELYPADDARTLYDQIGERLRSAVVPATPETRDLFSERDVTLITYGDTLLREGEPPLATLRAFLIRQLKGLISTVHILPFYPYSSDDGFSVIDYYKVNPALGSWDDVRLLSDDFRLMFDVVLNHMSAQSAWFQAFIDDEPEFRRLFMTESPDTDLSAVVRPRTSPLLTPFTKATGELVHVWTTFSADQVDLDYRDPGTLLRMLDVMLFYVAQGAQVLRLDAVGFLWKQPGTTSIHLPQAHAVVQVMRAVLDAVAPHVILISETNVPHAENITYFGDGENEAQLVYNFTLPPLLLHSLISGSGDKLAAWINTLETPSERTAFFNFTASHDGIGVRPVEGILSAGEVQALIDRVEANGGRVSYRQNADGSRSPYELNSTYFNALGVPGEPTERHIRRFLLSQAVMLALAGVPAVYIHSLLGSRNNVAGMLETGQNRTINRAKLDADALEAELSDPTTLRAQVFSGYANLIRARIRQAAFRPKAGQRATTLNEGRVLCIERTALSPEGKDGGERVIALFNLTDAAQTVSVDANAAGVDLLTGEAVQSPVEMDAYQVIWLHEKRADT